MLIPFDPERPNLEFMHVEECRIYRVSYAPILKEQDPRAPTFWSLCMHLLTKEEFIQRGNILYGKWRVLAIIHQLHLHKLSRGLSAIAELLVLLVYVL